MKEKAIKISENNIGEYFVNSVEINFLGINSESIIGINMTTLIFKISVVQNIKQKIKCQGRNRKDICNLQLTKKKKNDE